MDLVTDAFLETPIFSLELVFIEYYCPVAMIKKVCTAIAAF